MSKVVRRTRQQGIALISVLLITSLTLLVVGGLLRSQRLALQGTAQQIHQLQLRQAALTLEDRALQLLRVADDDGARNVHPGQPWASQAAQIRLPDLETRLVIEDLGGRFNLSRLTVPGEVDEIVVRRWRRLLDTLAIADFDLTPLNGVTLTDPSQLRLIPDLSADDLRRLLPYVAVLPVDTPLNVNTASTQVLASLEGISLSRARQLVSQRPVEGYADAQAFVRVPGLDGLGISSHGLGVSSRRFRITADVGLAGSHLGLVSDVERVTNTRRIRVIQRRLLAPAEYPTP